MGTIRKTVAYREASALSLQLHVYGQGVPADGLRPAIVFYHGGGWDSGGPSQFFPQCERLAALGMVAMSAQYRLLGKGATTVADCCADAKAAVRWAGEHAGELGVDTARLAVGGGSAGAHLAACTVLAEGFDDGVAVGVTPAAMVLFNPVLDTSAPKFAAKFSQNGPALSPIHCLKAPVPPTILFQGLTDTTTPPGVAKSFAERVSALSGICALELYDGRGHGFFNYRDGTNPDYEVTCARMEQFLREQGFIGQSASSVPGMRAAPGINRTPGTSV